MAGIMGGDEDCDLAQREKIVNLIDHTLKMRHIDRERLETSLEEHSQVKELLADLPSKLRHPAMIPMGPLAFQRGHIVRGNEVVTFLGDTYFAEQTASSASGFVSRRMSKIESEIKGIDESIQQLTERRAFFLQNQDADGNMNQGMEIREELDESIHLQPATRQTASTDQEDEDISFEDLMREIDQLEALEREYESSRDKTHSSQSTEQSDSGNNENENEGEVLTQTRTVRPKVRMTSCAKNLVIHCIKVVQHCSFCTEQASPGGSLADASVNVAHAQKREEASRDLGSRLRSNQERQVVNNFEIYERPIESSPAIDEHQQPEQNKMSKFMKARKSKS